MKTLKNPRIFGLELTNLKTYIRLTLHIIIESYKLRSRTRQHKLDNKDNAKFVRKLHINDRIGKLMQKGLVFYLRITSQLLNKRNELIIKC